MEQPVKKVRVSSRMRLVVFPEEMGLKTLSCLAISTVSIIIIESIYMAFKITCWFHFNTFKIILSAFCSEYSYSFL